MRTRAFLIATTTLFVATAAHADPIAVPTATTMADTTPAATNGSKSVARHLRRVSRVGTATTGADSFLPAIGSLFAVVAGSSALTAAAASAPTASPQ